MAPTRTERATLISDERPHICPECRKGFKRSSALTRHRETHDPATLNRFPCPKSGCGYRTRQASNLKTHIRSKHERKPACSCLSRPQIETNSAGVPNHCTSAHSSPQPALSPPVHTSNMDSLNNEGTPIDQCAIGVTFGDIYPGSNEIYAPPDTPPELVPAVWNVPPMHPQPYSNIAGHQQERVLPFFNLEGSQGYLPEPTNLDFAFDFGSVWQNDIGFAWDIFQ